MAKINTVLFDFDGTLMDTNEVIIQSWQHAFRTIEGKERPVEDILRTFGEPLSDTMLKFFPKLPVEESSEIYRSYHYDNFDKYIRVFPGLIELLQELKRRNYKTAVVTSRLLRTTRLGMEKFQLNQYFDVVITCDDTEKHKPDPEPILVALSKLDSRPEEAIMLGDTLFDILCAKNSGVTSVLVGWSMAISDRDNEKIKHHEPDFHLEKPEQLFELLEKLEETKDV